MKLSRRDNEYGQRWSIFDITRIPTPNGERTYLKRLRIIQTPWFGVYLHWINEPDADRDLHDHPWTWFTSTVLRGGYIESVSACTDRPSRRWTNAWPRWSTHCMTQDMCHRIEAVAPGTVTLIFVGRRRSSWGFYTDQGYVEHDQYFRGQ
jgi:hypothetical protein